VKEAAERTEHSNYKEEVSQDFHKASGGRGVSSFLAYSSCEYFQAYSRLELPGVKRTRESKFKNVIGERVKQARVAMKPPVSQEDLSGRLARQGITITQTSISKLENRERAVLDYEAQALAKVLKVSISWLYGEQGECERKKR
jgi:hypothetical protein